MDDAKLIDYLEGLLIKYEDDANINEEGSCYMCDRIRDEISYLKKKV